MKLTFGLTDFHEKSIWPWSSATEHGGPGTYYESPSRIWQGEIQTNYKVAKNILLTGGVSYRRDEGDYKKYDAENWRDLDSKTKLVRKMSPESNRYGIYLQAEINLLDNLDLYLGGRYDRWESEADLKTGTEKTHLEAEDRNTFSPKIAFVYRPLKDTTVRLSGGRAYNVPTFFQLYQNFAWGSSVYLPNPDLHPEITWSWELGVEQYLFGDKTNIKATYFENYTKDYIGSRTWTEDTTTYHQGENISKIKVQGLELEAQHKITDYLKLFLNYTYLDAEITEDPKYEGNRPSYVPEHMFNAGLYFHRNPFSASIITHYVSKVYGSFANNEKNWDVYGVMDKVNFVTDVKLGVDFLENFNASISVTNIFDEDYYQYSKAPGRTVFGMVTIKF